MKGCGLVSKLASPCRFSNGTASVNETWPPTRPPKSRSRTTSEPSCPRSRNLERAIAAYVQERVRFGHLDLAARSARAAADLARQRYQFGADNFLTVLDAERVRLEAEDQLAQSRVEVTRRPRPSQGARWRLVGGRTSHERTVADDDRAGCEDCRRRTKVTAERVWPLSRRGVRPGDRERRRQGEPVGDHSQRQAASAASRVQGSVIQVHRFFEPLRSMASSGD